MDIWRQAVLLWIGMGAANFLWQVFDEQDWWLAFERTYFQAVYMVGLLWVLS